MSDEQNCPKCGSTAKRDRLDSWFCDACGTSELDWLREENAHLHLAVAKINEADARFGHFGELGSRSDGETTPFSLLKELAGLVHAAAEAAKEKP